MLLPTTKADNVFTPQELESVDQLIQLVGNYDVEYSESYSDSGRNGRYHGKGVAEHVFWEYHQHTAIEKILTPKLESLIQRSLVVTNAHILNANLPYLLHTDFVHDNQGRLPEYTIIIPLDTYDSLTVCFNEWAENHNDFELFKQHYQGEKKLRIDPEFVVSRLSHIHPRDIVYLTLHDTFAWQKGSVFVMDRRYFHCSDNFIKHGLSTKRAIILWTLAP